MSRKYYLDDSFYKAIENLTLPDLEYFIEGLRDDMEINHEKINACLIQRKSMLEDIFECTPDNVERLHYIANLIKDNTKMLRDKGNQLYVQMQKLWQDGENEPFTDFRIEISLRISFNDEEISILHLDDDKSGSDYVRMAELLDDFYFQTHNHGNLITRDSIEKETMIEYFKPLELDGKEDDWGESWFFDKFPELQEMPITMEFHDLLFHSNYALQDIIRVNDVWSEVKVVWQHIYMPGEKES